MISTFVNYSATSANPSNRNLFVVGDAADAFNPSASLTAAVSGYAASQVNVGVAGRSTVNGSWVCTGRATTGVGVHAESDSGWDLLLGGTGACTSPSRRSRAHRPEGRTAPANWRDAGANFWVCVSGGSDAQWRRLAFADQGLTVIEPTRVYDSRFAGRIGGGEEARVISVADGIDLATGQVNAAASCPPAPPPCR